MLVERPGELIAKEEIMAAVWRRSVVQNANLTVQIAALRRVLDQGRSEGSCIQTVAVRGYRLVVPVTRIETADTPSMAAAPVAGAPRSAPRLSIVVLPFTDLSEDRRQQYFADGMTDDLTTDLSRLSGMFVIARNTAFTYRTSRLAPSRSATNSGCGTCWRAASDDWAVNSASTRNSSIPQPARIFGPSGSTAPQVICRLCKTITSGLRTRCMWS